MGKVLLNGRKPAEWELAAMERARQCELDRDMRALAGLLPDPEEPAPVHEGRPVTDIMWEFR